MARYFLFFGADIDVYRHQAVIGSLYTATMLAKRRDIISGCHLNRRILDKLARRNAAEHRFFMHRVFAVIFRSFLMTDCATLSRQIAREAHLLKTYRGNYPMPYHLLLHYNNYCRAATIHFIGCATLRQLRRVLIIWRHSSTYIHIYIYKQWRVVRCLIKIDQGRGICLKGVS